MDPLYTNPDTLALKATVSPESAGKFKGIAIMAALLVTLKKCIFQINCGKNTTARARSTKHFSGPQNATGCIW